MKAHPTKADLTCLDCGDIARTDRLSTRNRNRGFPQERIYIYVCVTETRKPHFSAMDITLRYANPTEEDVTLDNALQELPACDLDCIWSSWATQLDDSDALYVLSDDYDTLACATGVNVPHIRVTCGSTKMSFIGRVPDRKTTWKFWHENFAENAMTRFARILDEDLCNPDMVSHWDQSYKESLAYFRMHRRLVCGVGGLLGIDMDDHDLTKTTLVLYALGYLWHWPAQKPADGDIRKEAAWKVVREGHLTREDHHPEFSGGPVDAAKLFCDRLAIHLQKDPDDGVGGWGIDAKWLPTSLIAEWQTFRQKHGHIDLGQTLNV